MALQSSFELEDKRALAGLAAGKIMMVACFAVNFDAYVDGEIRGAGSSEEVFCEGSSALVEILHEDMILRGVQVQYRLKYCLGHQSGQHFTLNRS